MWRTTVVTCACLSHPSIPYSRLCNTQHPLSVVQHPTLSQIWLSRILVKSTAAITPTPIPLYLTYILIFDPVYTFLFPSPPKVSYHPSYVPLLLFLSAHNI